MRSAFGYRLAGNKDTLTLSQQVPDQIADGVRLPCAWRTLKRALRHVPRVCRAIRICSGFAGLLRRTCPLPLRPGHLRFASCSLVTGIWDSSPTMFQERPRQVFARPKIRQDALNGSGESQGASFARNRKRGRARWQGSFCSTSGAVSSLKSPRGDNWMTSRFRNPGCRTIQ